MNPEDGTNQPAPEKKVGPGHPPHPPFSSTHQPSNEAKRAGRLKGLRAQHLAQEVLNVVIKSRGKGMAKIRKEAADFFGIEEDELTAEVLLLYQQAKKGVLTGDTDAFRAIMDRAFGKPRQDIGLSIGPPPEPTEIKLPGGRTIVI